MRRSRSELSSYLSVKAVRIPALEGRWAGALYKGDLKLEQCPHAHFTDTGAIGCAIRRRLKINEEQERRAKDPKKPRRARGALWGGDSHVG